MIPKLLGKTTRETRPDLVDAARRMMMKMSPQGLSQVQQGLAERQDSVPTLKTINVPTLVVAGDEDQISPMADAELMRTNIPKAEMRVLPRAGHYAIFEQHENAGKLIRGFVDALPSN
jgi:pimeloyl-ACP methyl ester carboxylesterase